MADDAIALEAGRAMIVGGSHKEGDTEDRQADYGQAFTHVLSRLPF